MPVEVEAPDGTVVEFPDGMSEAEMAAAMQRQYGGPKPAQQVVHAPKSVRKSQSLGFQKGIFKPLDNAALALEAAVKRAGVDTNAINDALNMPSAAEAEQSRKDYLARQAMKGVVPGKAGNFAGEVVGTLPVGLITSNPLAAGAITGAALTDARDVKGVAVDAGLGAGAGKLGDVAAKAISSALAPRIAPQVKKLLGEGVNLTPGQIVGGVAKRAEDVASGLPLIGDVIRGAQARSLETFNRAAGNRALAPLNQSIPEHIAQGHEAVAHVGDVLSRGYSELLPKLKVQPDRDLMSGLARARQEAGGSLMADRFQQFNDIVTKQVLGRLRSKGLTGRAVQEADSELGRLIREYGSSASGDERQLAASLKDVQSELRLMLERQNPEHAETLKALREGWSNLAVLEDAASKGLEGVFTPQNLRAAARSADRSSRKRASARGTAVMQDLAEAAQTVLPPKVPDSGSTTRAIFSGVLGGAAAVANPKAALAAAAAAIPYTKLGGKVAQEVLTSRPAAVKAIGAGLREAGAAGAASHVGAVSSAEHKPAVTLRLGGRPVAQREDGSWYYEDTGEPVR